MASNPKRQPDAARRAKLTIQRRTLYLLLAFGIVSFAALFIKVYDLTINQHQEMQERASKQQTQSTTISASRGTIYDRNGNVLAISATADTIFLDPAAINDRAEEMDEIREKKLTEGLATGESLPMTGQEYKDLIASTLSELLEVDAETIYTRMEKTWSMYEVVKSRVDREIGDKVREFITTNKTGARIQGVYLQTDSKRVYPYGTLAAHALGFLGPENQGAYGLEAIYEDELEGSTGLVVTAKDARNREIMFQYEQYYDAQDGCSLELTIDSTIQAYVERGLEDMIAKYGAKNGAAGVVLDVNSGAILAIASSPTYDLNAQREIYDALLQAELDKAIPKDESGEPVEEMTEEQQEAYNKALGSLQMKQWRSKAVNDTYEPGSTYKILTLAAALEENKVNLNSSFTCNGSVKISGVSKPINCSKRTGHGVQDLTTATANSCNPAFIAMGLSLGTETYYQYMKNFGLFEKTGVDLQGEAVGVAASAEKFSTIDLACYAFGQNFTVTPLQLLAAQAACVNGGYLYTPYVVERVVDSDGNVVSQHDATPVRQVVSEETSATVRQILEHVVADGTGRNGQVAGYRIGGKTGTADKPNTKSADNNFKGDLVVSFLCFAPADDPQVIMLLTLDTPSRDTGTFPSGGNMVAPTSSAVMADILPYLGIAPQYTDEDKNAADATVPYVVGMTKDEAAAKLAEYGFTAYRTVGDGATVTDQTPLGGAIVPASAEIILYMGAEKSGEPCTVPNVVGLSAAKANKAITDAGLIMKTTGVTDEGSGIKAISQSLETGTQVAAGTVVTVQMGQTGGTAD